MQNMCVPHGSSKLLVWVLISKERDTKRIESVKSIEFEACGERRGGSAGGLLSVEARCWIHAAIVLVATVIQ